MRNKLMIAILAMAFMMAAQPVFGGDMDSPGEPSNPASNTYTLEDIYNRLDTGADGTQQPFTGPPAGAIGSTGHTINDVMGKAPAVDDTNGAIPADVKTGKKFWSIRSGTWGQVLTGTGTGGDTVDVPATGQTSTEPIDPAPAGSDGVLEKGTPWPSPRFTDNFDGTVKDNLTGLIWLEQANYNNVSGATGTANWADADAFCAALSTSECGLSDGSADGDWRLPSIEELQTLIDFSQSNPALPSGHLFAGVQSDGYWSSSSYAGFPSFAWLVYLNHGNVDAVADSTTKYVWPVRGGN